jgi:L-threonylcarbamoyladenylate synthase
MDMDAIRKGAELLRAGRLVAFPTETVYGLGANALDAAAVEQIFRVKGRPDTSPLIVHVASLEEAKGLTLEWPVAAELLAQHFWPGPLTLVLLKQASIPDIVTAGLATAGIRVPAHPMAIALIREAGFPVAAPSANRFTELSPTTAEHVRRSLGDQVPLILDGGPTPVGIESTVLSLAGGIPVLLRPGMISREEIEALIGPVKVAGIVGDAHPSPGMHARHYSPRTPLLLIPAGGGTPSGRGALISHRTESNPLDLMPTDPFAYAAALYSVLHNLDLQRFDWIAIEEVPREPAWDGIRDRLARAAEKPA